MTPDALAVAQGDRELTYPDLDARAEHLARGLRARGVGPETVVAIHLRKSPEAIVAILGVLKAGGASAQQDPDWGCRRVHLLVITDSQEECNAMDPCADIAALRSQADLTTSVIGIGQSPVNPLHCMALNGDGFESYPKTRQQIEQALTDYFDWVRQP